MRERFIFRQQIELRTHTFPWIFHLILFVIWSLWLGGIVVWVDPQVLRYTGLPIEYLPLLLFFFLWTTWLVGIIRHSIWKSLPWGVLAVSYLALRMYGLGEWWNGVLLILLGIVVEMYGRMNGEEKRKKS